MRAHALALTALAALLGCGDERAVRAQLEPQSGTRLALELYLYEDGTTQVDPSSFYDTRQHTQCTAQRWADGELRCVPVATEAMFSDPECAIVVGASPVTVKREPTHFLGYERVDDKRVPAHLYRAGARRTGVTDIYVRDGEACIGPNLPPSDVIFFAATDELPAQSMQQLVDDELGTGRLSLQIQQSPDGLRVLGGVLDRELGVTCIPTLHEGGAAWCEPTGATPASLYADAACTTPLVMVSSEPVEPAIASSVDDDGCATYSTLGAEVDGQLFRSNGTACVPTELPATYGARALGAPIELARLDRSVEDVADRRLQPVILEAQDDRELRFPATQLYDLAIRAECRRLQLGDDVRCLPALMPTATILYASGCALPVPVAILPERTCGSTTFARVPSFDDEVDTLHAIGDRVTSPLYTYAAAGCVVYVPRQGFEVRALGPAIAPAAFPVAVRYGER